MRTGALALDFAKSGFDVTALDLSEEMLMIASSRAQEADVDIQFVEGDMLDLTDIDTYEAVTCFLTRFVIWRMNKPSNKSLMACIKS